MLKNFRDQLSKFDDNDLLNNDANLKFESNVKIDSLKKSSQNL